MVVHAWLAITMTVLAVTSILITRSVPSSLQFTNNVSVIELHWFSAYWVAMIIAVHIGTHWTRVMISARTIFKLSASRIRTRTIRLFAVLLLGAGAWSFAVLGVSTKLTFGYSLEFWDFTSAVAPFFAHWTAVIAGVAVISHYAVVCLRSANRTRISATKGDA